MKHSIHLLGFLASVAMLFGCGTSEEQHAAGHAHDGASAAVADSGRWQANAETLDGIHGMQALVAGYPANGLTATLLRDSLDARISVIFQRCTMKGEAHEALHRYLIPLQGLIRRIPEGSSGSQLDSLQQHLRHYDEVFY